MKKYNTQKQKKSRAQPIDETGKLLSLAIFLYSIPYDIMYNTDALASFSGLGEHERINYANRTWEDKKTSARFFCIAGHNPKEHTWHPTTMSALKSPPYSIKKWQGVLLRERMDNTKEQAEWTAECVEKNNIKSIALFVTPFHLLRAYLTLLASLEQRDIKIPVIPVPVPTSPNKQNPELQIPSWDLLHGEKKRIIKYQKIGDNITYEKFRDYITWLWQQPILMKNANICKTN